MTETHVLKNVLCELSKLRDIMTLLFNDEEKYMNTENNDDFDFDLWLSAFEFIRTGSLTEDEWNDHYNTVTED